MGLSGWASFLSAPLRLYKCSRGVVRIQTKVIQSNVEPTFSVFGPRHQFLVDPADTSGGFGLMRAVVPSGFAIRLHKHRDPKVFFVPECVLEVRQYDDSFSRWLTARCGDVISMPSDVKHGPSIPIRNRGRRTRRICSAYSRSPLSIITGSLPLKRTKLLDSCNSSQRRLRKICLTQSVIEDTS
jgi:hypothetical protein